MGDLLVILFLMGTAFCYEVLYALNCGAEVEVGTHLVKYTSVLPILVRIKCLKVSIQKASKS
jgi:hypothetical protein